MRLVLGGDQRQAPPHVHDAHGPAARGPGHGDADEDVPDHPRPRDRRLVQLRQAEKVPALLPPPMPEGGYRMFQEDVERGQEFRKCIECFMCQDVCHVIRDHEENKPHYAGPRFFIRYAELEMHPLDTERPARPRARGDGPRLLQHHQVLHRGLPRAHQDHRQRHHPVEGARRRRRTTTRSRGSVARSAAGPSARPRTPPSSPPRSSWPTSSPTSGSTASTRRCAPPDRCRSNHDADDVSRRPRVHRRSVIGPATR